MNQIYKSIWNESSGTFVAVPENATGAGKQSSGISGAPSVARFAINALSACLMLSLGASVYALPANGVIAAGAATISSAGSATTITQSTANVVVNWQSFGIAAGQTVQFLQPGSTSVALNRVLGADPSSIMGNLSANGRVFLLNPNGVLFGSGASVNVGGLVASTMSLTDANFMAGNYSFTDAGSGTIINRGNITAADGGYVALMGKSVSNQGVISARLGSVALAAGNAVTMDVNGDGLLNISVAQGAVNALVENGGMIQADGGRVLLTAQAAGNLLHTVVNNTGVIQAQTIANRNGTILLLGDMETGTMNVGGTLDASAPNGGNGGFIETSAAHVNIRDDVRVTTVAPQGQMGSWLIDPQDFIIGAGGNISGVTLSAQLVNNSITIKTAPGPGNGDIFVNDAITWTAAGAPTTLTLNADRDTNINAAVTATNGNFSACCGRDVNVNAAMTTTNGSILLSAGRNVNLNAAVTTTDGNLMMCAANDVNISSKITVTNGTLDATRSLGLPRGLTISADTDGTGPGVAGGTVVFAPLAPPATVTNAPVLITYNPVSYTTPTDYSTKFILTAGAVLSQRMLVFPEATKYFDGNTSTILYSLRGDPPGVSLIAGPGATATFDDATAGTNKSVTFTGYTLGGPNAAQYALATTCCGPIVQKTTASIKPKADVPVAIPPLAVFASYQSAVMPTFFSDAGNVFFTFKEEEKEKEEVPAVVPAPPRQAYVAPTYAPKAARN